MTIERNELERLVKEEKYTIWQLCRHFEKSIHVAFFKWMKKLYPNENELNDIKTHILKNSTSLKSEIEFTKEYLETKINSGITFDELAEETGYPNSIKLYKYISSLYSDEKEKDKFMELLKSNNSSTKAEKEKNSNSKSKVEKKVKKNEYKKQVILLAADFIYRFSPEKLKKFIEETYKGIEIEFRVLRFSVTALTKNNFEKFHKTLSFANVKYIDFNTSYSYDIKNTDFVKETAYELSKSVRSYDGNDQKAFYSIDNDVILRYLVLNRNENIIVATCEKSLIISSQKLGVNTLFLYKDEYFVTNDDMYTIEGKTGRKIIPDTNLVYSRFERRYKIDWPKECLYIILNSVIYELPKNHFFDLIIKAKEDKNIVLMISSLLVNEDFIYNDISILVNAKLVLEQNSDSTFLTDDFCLGLESLCSGLKASCYENFLSNFANEESSNESFNSENASIIKITDVNVSDKDTKEKVHTNVITSDIYRTLPFKIENAYAVVNPNDSKKIEMVCTHAQTIVPKEFVSAFNNKETYRIKVGYLIKFVDDDYFYELITLRSSKNLKKTDLTLDFFCKSSLVV